MEERQSGDETTERTAVRDKRSLVEIIVAIGNSSLFGLVGCVILFLGATDFLWTYIQWRAEVGHDSWTDMILIVLGILIDIGLFVGIVITVGMMLHRPRQDKVAEKEIRRILIYKPEDVTFAQRLHRDLQERGYSSTLGEENLMQQAVQKHPLIFIHDDEYHQVLLVLSPQSRADAWMSQLVKTTLRLEGLKSRTILFLLAVEPVSAPAEGVWSSPKFCKHVVQDFTRWQDEQQYQHALEQLITDLEIATRMID